MYIGEIAEDKIRGGLGVLVIVMYNSGLVLVYSVGPWVSLLSLATIGIAIPAVSLATFVWIPESPYFYIMKNRPELARKSLQWLRGTTHVDEEIEVVKKNVEFDLQNAGTFKELLIDPGNGKGLLIVLFTCQQLSGILAVLSYSTIILNETGSGATSSISVIVIGLIQFVASFAPLFMADRIGRRPLLLGSMFFSIIFLITSLLFTATGFHFGWSSPTLPKLLEDTSIPVTQNQASLIISLLSFGSTVGPLLSIVTVDRWGRKTTMLLLSIPFIVSSILIAMAQNYWWYYVARVTCGLASGITWTIIPMYLGEIAEDRIRGGLGVTTSVMLNLGLLMAYTIGPWVSKPLLAALGTAIPVMFLLIFSRMPETPYFYMMKDKPNLARKSLEWLRGTTDVDQEVEVVRKNVEFDLQNSWALKELFTDKGNRKALLVVLGLMTAQELSGIAVITSYSTSILSEVGSGITSSVSVIIIGVIQLTVSVLVVFFTDRVGRRPLLFGSLFSIIVFLAALAVYFQLLANEDDVSVISWLPVTAMIGYVCSFTMGLGTIPTSIASEIFPCNVKAYASIIMNVYVFFIEGVILQLYPLLVNAYGIHVTLYIFAGCTTVSIIFTFFYVPETRMKSLGEIQLMLRKCSESNQTLQPVTTPVCSQNNSIYFISTNDVIK
ncbi:facilitated trehalose transporter Tret1-2 homolog [Neodiprion pinetum]|uniref:facilitated trehalose transporter Tret1-2 homolog n=1 Tax=Neodiprion pinetum TaxID=441929 RepID=UPI00371E5D57